MTTLNLQVGADDDDAHEFDDNTNFDPSAIHIQYADSVDPDARWNGGFRFQSVTIPPGSTIDSASVQLYVTVSEVHVDILAEDVDNAVDFATTADVTGRTRTTASVNWDANITGDEFNTSPDIKAVIQEVIDRGGWASGNAIVIFFDGMTTENELGKAQSYENTPANAAKLDITYTAGGGGGGALPERSYPRGVGRGVERGVA